MLLQTNKSGLKQILLQTIWVKCLKQCKFLKGAQVMDTMKLEFVRLLQLRELLSRLHFQEILGESLDRGMDFQMSEEKTTYQVRKSIRAMVLVYMWLNN